MLQTEFEERYGKRVDPEYYNQKVEPVYMAAEPVCKDVFCHEWKKIGGTKTVEALMATIDKLKIKNQNLEQDIEELTWTKNQYKEEAADLTEANRKMGEELDRARSDRMRLVTELLRRDLDDVAIGIVGHSYVIVAKCAENIEFTEKDKAQIAKELMNK